MQKKNKRKQTTNPAVIAAYKKKIAPPKVQQKIKTIMKEFNSGILKDAGAVIKNKDQALLMAFNEAVKVKKNNGKKKQ